MSRFSVPYSVAGHSRTFSARAVEDFLHDAVAVLFLAGQRQQDVKPVGLEGQKAFRIGRHIYIN